MRFLSGLKIGLALGTGLWLLAVPVLAATYTVTSVSDSGSNTYTLRGIIETTNSLPGCDVVHFDIGTNSITVSSALIITDQLFIDSQSQAIVVGSTATASGVDVFQLAAGSSGTTIVGLAIISANHGIIMASTYNLIYNCRLGLDWGQISHPLVCGIWDQGQYNRIGYPAGLNVIASNQTGILCQGAEYTRIQSNFICCNTLGTLAMGNDIGVDIYNSRYVLVGGNRAGNEVNVIAGSTNCGVRLRGNTSEGNTVCGNNIGVNLGLDIDLGNNYGIRIESASGNWIGRPANYCENVIGNNTLALYIGQSGGQVPRQNVIQNNFIGYYPLASMDLGNDNGILLSEAQNNLIGGRITTLESNIISGNRMVAAIGVDIQYSSGNSLSGNYIGTNDLGNFEIPNDTGVRVQYSNGNVIGGMNSSGYLEWGNIISGNLGDGLLLDTSQANLIQGNYIGLGLDGDTSLPNGSDGLAVVNCTGVNDLGGSVWAARNVIGNNGQNGVHLVLSSFQNLKGNCIGTNAAASQVRANQGYAVYAENATYCQLGGTLPEERNIICSTSRAIQWEGTVCQGNTLVGNWIGLLANYTMQPLPFQYGIYLAANVSGNFIGLSGSAQGNLICGAVQDNIYLEGSGGTNQFNGMFANTLTSAGALHIRLANGANAGQLPPSIITRFVDLITGQADINEYIEVFQAEPRIGAGGSLRFLGATQAAPTTGAWSLVPSGLVIGDYVCALATDGNNNTSEFSNNALITVPTSTNTPTFTASPTISPTPSISPTPTLSPTVSLTFTPTLVLSSTPSSTISPTSSSSPTFTQTPTYSPTATASPTFTSTNALAFVALGDQLTLAYPNPAKNQIQFLFHLESATKIEIMIYNMAGECITVISSSLPMGRGQTVAWDCSQVAAGIYLARVGWEGKERQKIKLAVIH